MLQITCAQCGKKLMGKEVIVTPFHAYIDGVRYQDFNATCANCGGSVVHERFAKKASANKAKAMTKIARKTGKSIKKISEEEQYTAIMRKTSKRAKEIAKAHSKPLRVKHLCKAIDELPPDEKRIVLAQEDKQDMELLKVKTNKPTKHISTNSILLLTQSIIEVAIQDGDEDFFQSQYGEYIVDTYNTTLAVHKGHNYEITAKLLLEKMRQGKIKVKGCEEENENA